jgi:hypothetical protein
MMQAIQHRMIFFLFLFFSPVDSYDQYVKIPTPLKVY